MGGYCFLSGLVTGVVFLVSFLKQQKGGQPLSTCVYLACMVDIFVIFIATVAIGLSVSGALLFVHIINPILIALYWFAFCEAKTMNWKGTFSLLVFPLLYMVFAFILFKVSGECPFPASLIYLNFSGIALIVIIFVLSVVLLVLGFVFSMLSNLVKRNKKN